MKRGNGIKGRDDRSTGIEIVMTDVLGHSIDSGIGLSITIDKIQVFINKTLSILSAYQQECINRRCSTSYLTKITDYQQ